MNNETKLIMATYKGHINGGNGYTSHDIEVSGVVTQAAAKALMEARNPGARITAVRMISNKDS